MKFWLPINRLQPPPPPPPPPPHTHTHTHTRTHAHTHTHTHRPPVLCEGLEDAYLFLKTDNALVTYYQDSPGLPHSLAHSLTHPLTHARASFALELNTSSHYQTVSYHHTTTTSLASQLTHVHLLTSYITTHKRTLHSHPTSQLTHIHSTHTITTHTHTLHSHTSQLTRIHTHTVHHNSHAYTPLTLYITTHTHTLHSHHHNSHTYTPLTLYITTHTLHSTHTITTHTPGIVPLGENPPPKYAFDVKLGTNTVINYSSYGNRQRIQLQKFFFPNDHTERPFTVLPEPGQKRIHTMFDVYFHALHPLIVYHLFSDRHGNSTHLAIAAGAGSTISIHQPWVYAQDGQLSVVKGSLNNIHVNSSLEYQTLGSAESLEFQTDLQFPRLWNATQTWDMRFTGDSVQANILFAYIDFANGKKGCLSIKAVD